MSREDLLELTLEELQEQAPESCPEVPEWLREQGLLEGLLAEIELGMYVGQALDTAKHGCASGTYMPAVTYWQAKAVMAEFGDDILNYLSEHCFGESVDWNRVTMFLLNSWGQACSFFHSLAVELWCQSLEAAMDDIQEELEVTE